MICVHPVNVGGRRVPCGRCINCRVNRGQSWSERLIRELEYWPDARFITLTYDDNYLPERGTLIPRDLSLFNKRLRKSLRQRKIRYYAVGEYGDRKGRPHYHGIYFGLGLSDYKLVDDAWGKGRVHLGTVTMLSINYVTAYITKKLWGFVAQREYTDRGLEPPFSRVSKGLGERWLNDNKLQLLADLALRRKGKLIPMPRYYFSKLRDEIPEQLLNDLTVLRGQERLVATLDAGVSVLELAEKERLARHQAELDAQARRSIDDARKGVVVKRL